MTLEIKTLTYLFFLYICITGYGQNNTDSLNQLEDLTSLYQKYIENKDNSEIARKYALDFKKKALELNVDEYICYGYYYLANSSDEINKIQYLDSIIYYYSKNLQQESFQQFPELAYRAKADWYYKKRKFDKSLDVLLEGLNVATKNNKPYYINDFNFTVGLIKSERLEQEKDALKIFRKVYQYYDSKENKENEESEYFSSLFALADINRKLGINDSATYYNKLGFRSAQQSADTFFINYFSFNEGLNQSYVGHSEAAIDSILTSISFLKKQGDIANLGLAHYYLGKSYLASQDLNKGLFHFNKMDSIFQTDYIFNIEQRAGFEYLVNFHKSKDDKIKQLRAIETLVRLDSIYMNQYKGIRDLMDIRFDRLSLLKERDVLLDTLDEQKSKSKKTVYFLLVIGIFLLSSTLIYYKKQRTYKYRFNEIMNSGHVEETTGEVDNNEDIGVPDKIVEQILANLSIFEKEEGYLNPKMNTHILAERLSTNSKYLSKVINQHKGQSIIVYINNLRIDYAIKRLKEDTQFRNYTIKAIAEEVGFNNPNSFSSAFEKRTKLKPSYFVKRILDTSNS